MKKIIYSLFLFMFMMVPNVYAEDNIVLKNIQQIDKSATTEELQTAKIENNEIYLNVKMYDINDFVKYKVSLQNTSNIDLELDGNDFHTEDNHLEYQFLFDNDFKVLEHGATKDVYLLVSYKSEVEKESFRNAEYVKDSLSTFQFKELSNPYTGNMYFYFIVLSMILIIIAIISKKKKGIVAAALLFLLVPVITYAVYSLPIKVHTTFTIGQVKRTPCTYDGNLTQGATYTDGQYTYKYKQELNGSSWNGISEDGWGVALTDKNSTSPVTTTMCTSINGKPIVSLNYAYYQSKATSVDLTSVDTSNVVRMNYAFSGMTNLSQIDISNFDTRNVVKMKELFSNDTALTSIDISPISTDSCDDFTGLVAFDTALKTVKMDHWDLSGQTNMASANGFFYGCSIDNLSLREFKPPQSGFWIGTNLTGSGIKNIDVTGWYLSETTSIDSIFEDCTSLLSITGLDSWDTSNITNMSKTFKNCTSITTIDVSSFVTIQTTNMTDMFYGCSQLKTIYGSMGFNASNASSSSNMFYGCYQIVGGAGSPYNSYYIDRLSARIDEPSEGRPGYFTRKT